MENGTAHTEHDGKLSKKTGSAEEVYEVQEGVQTLHVVLCPDQNTWRSWGQMEKSTYGFQLTVF